MLRNVTQLEGFVIHATDGELGAVYQLYFDDETWFIRYLTVELGWLGGRRVLISPISVTHVDWIGKRLDVALTKSQVENSPNIDTDKPVSRQHEIAYSGYYGYPYYWGGAFLGGPTYYPGAVDVPKDASTQAMAARTGGNKSTDSHLRSTKAVTGYHIEATDGEIGHVGAFIVDDEAWAIRYIEVATKNWWPGKKVLVSPAWIERVSWEDSKVYVGLSREAIKSAPEFVDFTPITREYENRLYSHYGRPPYWLHEAEYRRSLSLSGV
jgi:hypothetical protein